MKWLAPAKINLSLRVLGRRADGFHEIETWMVPLSLADELSVEPVVDRAAADIALLCSDPTLPTDAGNLAYRAAALFRDRAKSPVPAVCIRLTKHIPHGAGLGGGSSDAASVLLALNALCGSRLNVPQLAALGAELGSDVPFFVHQSAAVCRGRGEQVTPLRSAVPLALLLIKPSFSIPTVWAYQRWRDSREIPGVRYTPQVFGWGELVNDLERPVFEKYCALAEMKNWLLSQPEVAGALLSGSGSTMIAVLRAGSENSQRLSQRVGERFGEMWICPCESLSTPGNGTSRAATTPETF